MYQNWPKGVKAIFGIKKTPGFVGGKSEIQSLIFSKVDWSVAKVKNWLKSHKFKFGYIDESKNYWRVRQHEPNEYQRFATSNPPESVEKYLRNAVRLAAKHYSDPEDLLNDLQHYLEDVVYTLYDEQED